MAATETQPADQANTEPISDHGAMRIEQRGRYWAVLDDDVLVCLTLYLKGAREVVRRLQHQR